MSNTHWSHSQLATCQKCPLQYFLRHVLCLPERTTTSTLALGSALHQALAVYHRAVQQGEPLQPAAVQTAFRQAWQERKNNELIVFQHGDERAVIDQGMALLDVYLQEPAPSDILGVEQQLVTPLVHSRGQALDRSLVSVIDLIHRSEDHNLTVMDIRTSSRACSDVEVQLSPQATACLHAAQQQHNEPVTFEFQVLVRTLKPRIQRIATARTPTDFGRLGDLVEVIDRAVAAGIHYPVESPLNCSGRPHRKPCRQWQSDQTLPPGRNRVPLSVVEGNGRVG